MTLLCYPCLKHPFGSVMTGFWQASYLFLLSTEWISISREAEDLTPDCGGKQIRLGEKVENDGLDDTIDGQSN